MKDVYYLLLVSSLLVLVFRWKMVDKRLRIYIPIFILAITTEKIRDYLYPQDISKQAYHFYHFAEMLLLSVYYITLFKKPAHKKICVAGFLIFSVYFIYTYFMQPGNLLTDKRGELVVQGILITIYSLMYLYQLYLSEDAGQPYGNVHFWVVTVNLIYYSGGVFFNGYIYYLLSMKMKVYDQLAYIMIVLNYLLYTVYLISFICHKTTVTRRSL